MALTTTCKKSATNLENKGWTKIDTGNEYILIPPGKEVPLRYQKLSNSKIITEKKSSDRSELIRSLLSEGKQKKEVIEIVVKKFPEGSKVGISSQVYGIASKMVKV